MGQTERRFARVKVNAQGRIVIPADMRSDLGIKPGASVVVYEEDGKLVLTTNEAVWASLMQMFAGERAGSVVDELMAERREEARLEAEETRRWLQQQPPAPKK